MKKNNMFWNLRHRAKEEDGQAMVLAAVAMVVIIGFAGFAVDIGNIALQKSDLQNAADAAALAGAAELPSTSAVNVALTYAIDNGMDVTTNNVTQNGEKVYAFTVGSNQVEVKCTREVKYYFAGIFGLKNKEVTAYAIAQKSGNSSGISGLRPWALSDYDYTYGLEFVLKVGGGGGSNGYYGIVGFGSQNANSGAVYKSNITNGYDGTVKVGDTVLAGSGNTNVKNVINALMTESGDTTGDYTKATIGNSRVVVVPKIDSQTLEVIGFAVIYLKSVDNKGYITANFLYDTTWTDEQKGSLEDWGLNSNIKLVE